jgi:hypothetical protein
MPVTKVGSKWDTDGGLIFYKKSTGATLIKIGPDFVDIPRLAIESASNSPSSSPSESPSASPSASPSS